MLTWRGTVINSLLGVLLTSVGFDCEAVDVRVTLTGATLDDARDVIGSLDGCPPIETLASFAANLQAEKYDGFVSEDLLRRFWVKRHAHLRGSLAELIVELARES